MTAERDWTVWTTREKVSNAKERSPNRTIKRRYLGFKGTKDIFELVLVGRY